MKHSLLTEHSALNSTSGNHDYILETLSNGLADTQHRQNLGRAFKLGVDAQDKQDRRPAGIHVATILKHIGVDPDTLIAALLSDPRLRHSLSCHQIKENFGTSIANIVHHVHWLNTFKECTKETHYAPEESETLRRMLLATVDDVRAVLIKLAFRVQRLRKLKNEKPNVQRCIARETMDVYAPIANRLGIAQLKWEMEDLAFRYLEPDMYMKLAKSMEEKRVAREKYIENFTALLQAEIGKTGIEAKITGRAKHLYSAWHKMERKQVGLADLADMLAVRVIVKDIPQCYMVLGMAHNLWKHLPHEFDDYVATPKGNGYQSIHTAVIGPNGRIVEIQIRTFEMDEFAENGVAAHWRYKEGSKQDLAMEENISNLRYMLEHLEDAEELRDNFNAELFKDRVYVMTPKGDVIDLINGATPLDFAYAIRTSLGHRSRGARVNGKSVPLAYTLNSGEKVEIITTQRIQPRLEWVDSRLNYLTTSKARSKVRNWFKNQPKTVQELEGSLILENEMHQLGIEEIDTHELCKHFNIRGEESLLRSLGSAQINTAKVAEALSLPDVSANAFTGFTPIYNENTNNLGIEGVGNLPTHIAECCKPASGDDIVGYVVYENSQQLVYIHRQDCPGMLALSDSESKQLIEVNWGTTEDNTAVLIHIDAFDRKRLLTDITNVLTAAKTNILDIHTHTDTGNQSVKMDLFIQVSDTVQLSLVLDRISALPNVFAARRSSKQTAETNI